VRAVLLDAFPQPDEANLVDALRRGAAFLPGLSWVAQAGDTVVGQVLFTRLHVRGSERKPGLALAPMAIAKPFQRLGIGGQLMRAGLSAAREQGEPFVVVLGHADYYPRFGFARASSFGIRAPMEVPDANLMALELRPGGLAGVSGIVEWAPEFGISG
jgi:predicted N-acetyltransferase YhbS